MIDVGMGDTCYPNFVMFTMDYFERHLCLYYFSGIYPSPSIHMKFNSRSVDTVQVNDFLQKTLVKICEATQVV